MILWLMLAQLLNQISFYDEFGSLILIKISFANIRRAEIYYFCKYLSLRIPAINYFTRKWICWHKTSKTRTTMLKEKLDEHVLETLQSFLINESINLLIKCF